MEIKVVLNALDVSVGSPDLSNAGKMGSIGVAPTGVILR